MFAVVGFYGNAEKPATVAGSARTGKGEVEALADALWNRYPEETFIAVAIGWTDGEGFTVDAERAKAEPPQTALAYEGWTAL